MKLKIQFNPLFFQSSLAAGGVALMAFNFLQFAIPHGKGLIEFTDIAWRSLSGVQTMLYAILVVSMLVSVVAHIALTTFFLKGLAEWVSNKKATAELMNDPYKNVTVFPVIGSLAMSANVLWAPVGFFVPQVSSGLQSLMMPSLIYFAVLWSVMIALELKVLKEWFHASVDFRKFNFVWLLDVFAFGLVSLTGSGVAITSGDPQISRLAVAGTILTIVVGLLLLVFKLSYLVIKQIKAKKLPDEAILPAFFLVVPITCLFGLSLYRIAAYFQSLFSVDLSGIASYIVNLSYIIAIAWVISTVYLLGYYFKNQFLKSKYSAPQWGMVWALVGSQILGVYVQGLYIKNSYLAALNFVSIILAVFVYTLIIIKFYKSIIPVKS